MKVLRKNVYYGSKCVCTKYSSEMYGGSPDCFIGGTEIEGSPISQEDIFVKVGPDDYREINDLYNASKKLLHIAPKSVVIKLAMQKYSTNPRNVGELYVNDLKHMFTIAEDEKIDIKDLLFIANNKGLQGFIDINN